MLFYFDIIAVIIISICLFENIYKHNKSAYIGWFVAFIYSLMILRHSI